MGFAEVVDAHTERSLLLPQPVCGRGRKTGDKFIDSLAAAAAAATRSPCVRGGGGPETYYKLGSARRAAAAAPLIILFGEDDTPRTLSGTRCAGEICFCAPLFGSDGERNGQHSVVGWWW